MVEQWLAALWTLWFLLLIKDIFMATKKFIQSAIKKPGQLHKDLGVPIGEKIPAAKLAAAAVVGAILFDS